MSQSLSAYIKANPSIEAQFNNALKTQNAAATFISSLVEMVATDNKLRECSNKDLVCVALKAATLGLPINKTLGQAYIIPYNYNIKNSDGTWSKVVRPEFIIGYKGLIQLALRTAKVKRLNAGIVYEGELQAGDKIRGEFVVDPTKRKSDNVEGYFAYIETTDGFSKTIYTPLINMAQHCKKYGNNIDQRLTIDDLMQKANAPRYEKTKMMGWTENFNDMAIKTCLRDLLSTYAPLSIETLEAINSDMQTTPQEEIVDAGEVVEVTEPTDPTAPIDNPQPQIIDTKSVFGI